MTKNAYIHIPFCAKKCFYCSFVSFNKLQKKVEYLTALAAEIKECYKGERLNTLYIGGGTPSLLSADEITRLVSQFQLEKNAEVTIEANPNRLSLDYLRNIRACGINRISIGAQTFDDNLLKEIGRLHKSVDVKSAVKSVREAGFQNISIDLIYGLPNQSLMDFENSLNEAVNLGVEHVSLYGLKIEEGSYFWTNMPKNIADDDLQADMYLLAGDVLRKNGFEKYEISNFAKKGYESRHNTNYWNSGTYYGFGCGAHGYENGIRYENQIELDKYIEAPLKKLSLSTLSDEEKLEEAIFLGFRRASGVDVSEIKRLYSYDLDVEKGTALSKFIASGHIIKTHKGYAFSDEGFLISDYIFGEIL